jgi:hypothetical protein
VIKEGKKFKKWKKTNLVNREEKKLEHRRRKKSDRTGLT